MQIVERDRLIEANARNALASSGADVAGPGLAGALIRLLGAPVALLFNVVLPLLSAAILGGIHVDDPPPRRAGGFWPELKAGLRFVHANRLLVVLASCVAAWQLCCNSAAVVNILFATRTLGVSAQDVGLSYVCLGIGTVFASLIGGHLSRRIGPGSCLALGFGLSSCGWLMLAAVPVGSWGVVAFDVELTLLGIGAVLIFVNFISLRQAVTPAPMLGRMTSTMRWLILIPAGPGALIGGWLGEHADLRASLGFAGVGGMVLTVAACCMSPPPRPSTSTGSRPGSPDAHSHQPEPHVLPHSSPSRRLRQQCPTLWRSSRKSLDSARFLRRTHRPRLPGGCILPPHVSATALCLGRRRSPCPRS